MKFLSAVSLLSAGVASTQAFSPVVPSTVTATTSASQPFAATHHNSILTRATSRSYHPPSFLKMSSSPTLSEAKSMRVAELKAELESYGISTKSFLEKSELVQAVDKARAEGKTPSQNKTSSSNTSSNTSPENNSQSTSSSDTSSESRQEKLATEMENCKAMKAGELKKELESYGIPTASFFEKSEFVKACAEARVDGVVSKKTSGTGAGGSDEEGYAEYADVEVLTDDNAGPRKKSSEQGQGQQGGGGSPFGGAGGGGAGGNPMGDMGGMADMMKNMGMGGGGGAGGANPMGGMADMMKNMGMGGGGGGAGGGNPMGGMADMMKNMGMGGGGGGMGGDTMKKAQQMMSNPKVMEIISKAQTNPKIMKAVQECMGNPAAFAKYQNDPEVGELIRELQKYMA